ncbi:MAG TPA: DNA repair protein RecN [Gammaproteobacteria bacterium]
MLRHLHIRNFALVEHLELEFAPGRSVLSGETGAGKSILLDALGLTLGDRADSAVVRHGTERADISATFDLRDIPAVHGWLKEHELDSEAECILRRTINADGGSRAFINGQPVPLTSLRELGEQLVDIHGQHAHQSLLKRDQQRQLLDDYAGLTTEVQTLNGHYRQWRALHDELEHLRQAQQDREARLELLRYQVDELEKLNITAEELTELDTEHGRLANATRLAEGSQQITALLQDDDENSAISLLERGLSQLQELQSYDARLTTASELLEGAIIQAKEGASELRHYVENIEIDPQRLMDVEQRLGAIHDLSRKHRVDSSELPHLLGTLQEELGTLEASESRFGTLEGEIAALRKLYEQLADAISVKRKAAAQQLAQLVTANMQELGMGGGRFEIAVDQGDRHEPAPHGWDRVELMVTANPGQPLRPMAKVASGGELSRISLAIQVIAAGSGGIPTLIFDEVDVGVGGGTAEIVGRQLRRLGSERQILCVTHQPQVAAQGHHHFQIRKSSSKGATRTEVMPLTGEARVAEVARMSGGVEITEQTLSHAREMIERAQQESGARKRRKA